MIYELLRSSIPRPLLRHVKHFESTVEEAVGAFAASLPKNSRVLDAGAGEGMYKHHFAGHRYVGFDLAIGDHTWNYSQLDARGDLEALPFPADTFDAALSVVTLEHVKHPDRVIAETARSLKPGGRLLLVVPLQWEEHQQPHDYFRYTRYGLRHLLTEAGMEVTSLEPVGGIFRLLSRRLFGATAAVPFPLDILLFVAFVIPALVLPFFDSFDKEKPSTLGFVCCARKS